MASNIIKSLVVALAILAGCLNAYCQEEEQPDPYYDQPIKIRKLNEAKRKSLVKDLNFDETEKASKKSKKNESEKDGTKAVEESEEEEEMIGKEVINLGPAAKIIIYIAIIFLIAFILVYLLRTNWFANKSVKTSRKASTIDTIEEQLHESDLDHFLKEATSKGNYRLAIRIYYLMILKELSVRNHIHWKKDKTNREYVNEMSGRNDSALFNQVTRMFEVVWYGKTELHEAEYRTLSPLFKKFIEGLNSTTHA